MLTKHKFQYFSLIASIATIVSGILVLIEWSSNIQLLKSILANFATIKPITALSFIFLGIALWLQSAQIAINPIIKTITIACCIFPLVIGFSTLIEYFFDINFFLNEIVFFKLTSTETTANPGPLPHTTAIVIFIYGAAMWLLQQNPKKNIIKIQLIGILGMFIGLVAIVGYIFDVPPLYSLIISSISLPTSMLIMLFGFGIISSKPNLGLMAVITEENYGGVLARRILPLIIVLTYLIGWIVLKGQIAGWYKTEVSMIIFATSETFIIITIAWWNFKNLNKIDRARLKNEKDASHFTAIIESSEDAIISKDMQGFITSWNVGAEKIFGYKAEEMIGQSITRLIPLDHQNEEFVIINQISHGQQVNSFDTVRLHKNGERLDLSITISPIRDQNNNIVGASKVARDISVRKLTETTLKESEEQFRTMADAMLHLAWIANSDGFIYWYNERWYEFTGTTFEDMQGWGWQSVHHPEMLTGVIEIWKHSIEIGQPFEMEFPLRSADGSYHWFLTRAIPFKNAEGILVKWFGTNTDINENRQSAEEIKRLNAELELRVIERTTQLETINLELRQNRAELNSLFESLPGLYLVLAVDMKIAFVSDAYLTATMINRDSIVGCYLFDIFLNNPDEPDANWVANLRASINRVLEKGLPDVMAIQKYDIRRPDGIFETHYWSPINSPVFGVNRDIKYIVHRVEKVTDFVLKKTKSDINTDQLNTKVQQMEAEVFQSTQKLEATNHQLEFANKELEAFSYSVSHDLRAPLRHINGFINLLEKRVGNTLDQKSLNYFKTISEASQLMSHLIDDLLSFSRMTRIDMLTKEVNMQILSEETVQSLKSSMGSRNINFKINNLPNVYGDQSMLHQVLVNLISNAIKFTKLAVVAEIEIGAETNKNEIIFFVRDNGVGFDLQFVGKLFGVFQRLHLAEDFEGTGIGLAIVRRVIERHGGKTWAKGVLNEGAIFYFSLPIKN